MKEKDPIKVLRKKAEKIGLPETARRAQINETQIYRQLSNDGNPRLENVLKIAEALGYVIKLEKKA